MAVIEIAKIQVRRGQENQTGIPQLAGGEFAWAEDTENLYIGLKREDGGARDANIRVLTENDISLLSSAASGNILNTNTNYIWNFFNSPEITSSEYITTLTGQDVVIRVIQDKLDEFVSIADFITTATTEDCSIGVQAAIDHLFLDMDLNNTSTHYDTAQTLKYNKKLYFPAGIYKIGQTLKIPRNTVIVGEGIDKTIIEINTTGTGIFKTVDWNGRRNSWNEAEEYQGEFDDSTTSSATLSITGPGRPKNIHIEGMTLRHAETADVNSSVALLSLDCVDNATVRSVKFQGWDTWNNPQSNPDYTGIYIRGYSVCSSENILIDNCQFTGLYYDIKSNHDSNHIIIQNNSFKESVFGIGFNTATNAVSTNGPTYSRIVNNKFENINYQGIYVGINLSNKSTFHVSENNSFINVGDRGIAEGSNSVGTSVIKFGTAGNASVNDYFGREFFHNQNFGTTYTYYPLIEGRATIDLNSVSTSTLFANTATTIMKLPITGEAQYLNLKYNCTSSDGVVNKMGNLQVYIRPGATPSDVSLLDDYNSHGSDGGIYWGITVEPTYKYYELLGVNPTLTSIVHVEMQTKLML